MKKYIVLFVMIAGFATASAQGFKAGFGAGYLTEFDTGAASADLLYEVTEKIGVGTTFGFGVSEFNDDVRNTIFFIDVNGRYKAYKELYLLAGVQYISNSFSEKGGNILPMSGSLPESTSDIGANLGTGYVLNIIDNVNVFGEVKYTFIEDNGYLHARLGLLFSF